METSKINDLLREAVARHAANQQALAEQIAQLRSELTNAAADSDETTLRRFAQGLQSLVDRLESRLDNMSGSLLESIAKIAEAQREASDSLADRLSDIASEQDRVLRSATRALLGRLRTVTARLDESNELSKHLQGQSEALDDIVTRLAKAPKRIDAAIAQGMKRSNAVAQSIADSATEATSDMIAEMRDEVSQIAGSMDTPGVKAVLEELVERVGKIEDRISKIAPAPPARRKSK